MARFNIGKRNLDADSPAYVIAEMSANHNGSLENALRWVASAKSAGADAVKMQTYTADTLTLNSSNEWFQIQSGTVWSGRTLHDVYSEAFTPWEWQGTIKTQAESLGMDCFSSPFDATAVAFLETLEVPAYKIASFELVDIPLIECVARTGKPLILSTGMATLAEITEAVGAFRNAGGGDLALLKCTSAYPASIEEMNLKTIMDLSHQFDVVTGLSDHSMEPLVPVAAVCLGARIIEKHLTLSRDISGPDSSFSLEPDEFAEMVRFIRLAEKASGRVLYGGSEKEEGMRAYRRSLFATQDIAVGDLFSNDNIRSIRPAHGLHTRFLNQLLGRQARRLIPFGTPIKAEDLG